MAKVKHTEEIVKVERTYSLLDLSEDEALYIRDILGNVSGGLHYNLYDILDEALMANEVREKYYVEGHPVAKIK